MFSDKAQKQAKDDLQATSDAACRLGGADCTCKGGTMVEDRRTVSTFEVISGEKAGTWCQYGLWLRMEGGTCQ